MQFQWEVDIQITWYYILQLRCFYPNEKSTHENSLGHALKWTWGWRSTSVLGFPPGPTLRAKFTQFPWSSCHSYVSFRLAEPHWNHPNFSVPHVELVVWALHSFTSSSKGPSFFVIFETTSTFSRRRSCLCQYPNSSVAWVCCSMVFRWTVWGTGRICIGNYHASHSHKPQKEYMIWVLNEPVGGCWIFVFFLLTVVVVFLLMCMILGV